MPLFSSVISRMSFGIAVLCSAREDLGVLLHAIGEELKKLL